MLSSSRERERMCYWHKRVLQPRLQQGMTSDEFMGEERARIPVLYTLGEKGAESETESRPQRFKCCTSFCISKSERQHAKDCRATMSENYVLH